MWLVSNLVCAPAIAIYLGEPWSGRRWYAARLGCGDARGYGDYRGRRVRQQYGRVGDDWRLY
jgi:hypothetical protein